MIDPPDALRVASAMDYSERITIEPGQRGGKPCIRGMRITVSEVLDYLASGMSEQQILDEFPGLEREDIKAVLAFAADGSEFAARPVPSQGSPLDVPGVATDVTREEILAAINESRERDAGRH